MHSGVKLAYSADQRTVYKSQLILIMRDHNMKTKQDVITEFPSEYMLR